MIVYWILLLIIAFPAYYIGSISTLRVASRFVFRQNLRRLGKGSAWVSNFKRIFGWWGFAKLLLTEAVKDLIPILLGAAVLAVKHHPAVGAAFGGYCMLVGRLWPMFNRFRGTHHGCVALVVAALSVNFSVGASAVVVIIGVLLLTRFFSLSALAGAAIVIVTALLLVDDRLLMLLCICTAGLIFLYHIPALWRLSQGTEERFNFKEDITYKLDE